MPSGLEFSVYADEVGLFSADLPLGAAYSPPP